MRTIYLTFFGLKEIPFSLAPDPRYLFPSASVTEAWSRLTDRFDGQGGLAVLMGGGGMGKTLLSGALRAHFAHASAAVKIALGATGGELLASIHHALHGPDSPQERNEHVLLERLNESIEFRAERDERTVIVIDEAHHLTPEMLRHLQALLETGRRMGKPPGLVLIGQPELRSLVESGPLEQEVVSAELRPFTERETVNYISHRMGIAGAVEPIFTKAASLCVYRFSQGVPRMINAICSHALLSAQLQLEHVVTARMVRQVAGDVPPAHAGETRIRRFSGEVIRRGLEIWSDNVCRIGGFRTRGYSSALPPVTGFAPAPGGMSALPVIPEREGGPPALAAPAAATSEFREARPPAGHATPAGTPVKAAVRRPDPASADIPKGMVFIAETALKSAYGESPSRVGAFLLDRTPVTNEAYARFVEETGYRSPGYWFKGRPPPPLREHPVVGISLRDAQLYADWLGMRLPTPAEWEAAARRPDGRRFPWGDAWDPKLCNTAGYGPGHSTPVGAFPAGSSYDGCLDLVGNVWEWTADDNHEGPRDGDYAWVYGGSFRHDCDVGDAIARTRVMISHRFSHLGFRCAGDLP